MARTERESDRRREVANLLVLPRLAKSSQNGTGFGSAIRRRRANGGSINIKA